jgi:soluble lytic murein transglycosylase-like protein
MDMKERVPSFIFVCLVVILPLYAAGHLTFVDHALAAFFDSALSPLTPTSSVSGPMPREIALRRLVEKTETLLLLEGRRVDKTRLIEIARIADKAGLQYRLPPSLIMSLIHTESAFQRDAVSSQGAIGLMQVQPQTALHFANMEGIDLPRGEPLYNPETNILLGTGYLRHLIDRFGDLRTALAAYHVGPTEIGRRRDMGEPFSDRYGSEIRIRETYSAAPAPARPVVSPVKAETVAVSAAS